MQRVLSALLVALAMWPSIASADLAAQARFHHEQAARHYVAGRYEAALEEFFAVQRIAPSSGTLFNIARCFERLHRDEETYLFYSEYLASDDDEESQRRIATEAIARLDEHVARVRVVTTPPNADVFVDQRDRGRYGRTPMVVAVPAGTREITAALEGYRGASAQVEAVAGQEVEVHLALEQILGGLTVRGPRAGRYVVRDEQGAEVAAGALGERVVIAPGSYVLEAAVDGYQPWRTITRVEADRDVVTVAEPQPLPAPSGALTVTANRTGALIRIDGEPAGFVPLALPTLGVGDHTVAVSHAGDRAWEGRVEIRANERAWVTASLTPPASTDRSPITWVIGGLGVAGLLTGGVLVGLATHQHSQFEGELGASSPDPNVLSSLRDQGVAFNTAADATLILGAIGLGVGITLFFLTESTTDEPPSATITREAR
ncbi:MAG: PEGA domain-containing protein [Sandaracinaceae bacterium]|nr:PEGA domain-containing protein [Sandaracinaceae bacterium]